MLLCKPGSKALVKPRWIELIALIAAPLFMRPISLGKKKEKEIILACKSILDKSMSASLNHLIS